MAREYLSLFSPTIEDKCRGLMSESLCLKGDNRLLWVACCRNDPGEKTPHTTSGGKDWSSSKCTAQQKRSGIQIENWFYNKVPIQ